MDKEKGSSTKLVSFTRSRYVPIKRKSLHRYIKSHTAGVPRKKSNSSTYDPCGLSGNYDVFSDDDVLKHKKVSERRKHFDNKFIKSQLLSNKITKEEIQRKFELIDQENAKVQIKIKSLFKNILKKDKIINELNKTNEQLKERLQATAENNTIQNTDLIELANANSRLQKDIEKKKEEITTLQSKINKSEFIRSNLLKDIEFYKTELSAAKSESNSQKQKYSEYEYEKLQKKFYEIKIENNKLCRKFKEIRSDDENMPRTQSYHVLYKKFETVQHDLMKLKMENKALKEKIRKNKQTFDDEISVVTQNSIKLINEEIENLTQIKEKLEIENEHIKALLAEVQSEANNTKAILIDTQTQLQEKISYCRQSDEEIKNFNLLCNDLQHQLKTVKTEKETILKQHSINEETNNMLKLKLDELMRERLELLTQKTNIDKADEEHSCENCILLRYEVEKLGYANLRLQKEKQILQSNFQKLSIKTSKLTLRMEELEQQRQNVNQQREDHVTDESLMQQNVLLSKRLHNLLKKSEKLFKIHVQQSTISEKDIMSPLTSNDKIIAELTENLSFSKSNLEMIENKLNEEEWKLNAALKHIRQVKEQIKVET